MVKGSGHSLAAVIGGAEISVNIVAGAVAEGCMTAAALEMEMFIDHEGQEMGGLASGTDGEFGWDGVVIFVHDLDGFEFKLSIHGCNRNTKFVKVTRVRKRGRRQQKNLVLARGIGELVEKLAQQSGKSSQEMLELIVVQGGFDFWARQGGADFLRNWLERFGGG